MIDPVFRQGCEEFYDSLKSRKQVSISLKVIQSIKNDVKSIAGPHILIDEEKIAKAVNVLAIFVHRREEVTYEFGMNYIAAVLLIVFNDEKKAFVMFCHIIEKVFPFKYFEKTDRNWARHAELTTLAQMARVLRPKTLNTLKTEFYVKESRKKLNDFFAFDEFVKKSTFGWIRALFVPNLLFDDLCRVWDCAFVLGFEFIGKFALCLLSHYEGFVKDNVKKETKELAAGISVEALLVAGNLTRAKLMRKLEKLPVEKMVKKCWNKEKYRKVKRTEFLDRWRLEGEDQSDRVLRLRAVRESVVKCGGLEFEMVLRLLPSLASLSIQQEISRGLFTSIGTKELNWSLPTILKFFSTFDQQGNDSLSFQSIFMSIALVSSCSIEEKFRLCFELYSSNSSIFMESACDLLASLEEMIDYKSVIVRYNLKLISLKMEKKMDFDSFFSVICSDPYCEVLIKLINTIENNESLENLDLSVTSFAERYYTGTHSPLKGSGFMSSDSEESDDDMKKVTEITFRKSYDQRIQEKIKVEFEFIEMNKDGISIFNEYQGNSIKFIVAYGIEDVKDDESFSAIDEKSVKFTDKDITTEFTRTIDIPEMNKLPKERAGCARLCSVQNCQSF